MDSRFSSLPFSLPPPPLSSQVTCQLLKHFNLAVDTKPVVAEAVSLKAPSIDIVGTVRLASPSLLSHF